jgi:circadian clock protein KaiC
MPTGIPGLDHLLGGGLVRGNSLLIEGPPGSGKSTFGVRILYEGIVKFKEPGLLITFEEFPKQVYQEALVYGVDLRLMEDAGKLRVIWTPPSRILEGFTGKSDLIEKIVDELGVRRLVIDSVTHFKRIAASEVELREILLKILNNLKLKGINSILLKELERMDSQTIAFEEYLVDASMRVYNAPADGSGENTRYLEVRKTRGQGHISGRHPFRLGGSGLAVYPHLTPKDLPREVPRADKSPAVRLPTGITGLDAMLSGGFHNGSLNLAVGYSGTGKSVIGYHFLDAGLKAGKPVLLVTLKSSPDQILFQAEALGMFWRDAWQTGLLRFLHYHYSGLCVEQVMDDLLKCIGEQLPERFVLESASDLWNASRDKNSVRYTLLLLRSLFETTGITALVTQQARQLGGEAVDAQNDYSDLADSVIQLSMAESDGELRRFVGVHKHRGSEHAKELREFHIGPFGFRVDRKAVGLSGILTGQTQGSLRQLGEEVLPPLDKVANVLRSITEGVEPPEDLRERLKEARSDLGFVDVLLREHFGVTEFHRLAEESEPVEQIDPLVPEAAPSASIHNEVSS